MRIEFLHTIYWKGFNFYWKMLSRHFPVYATKKKYKQRLGYTPDLNDPKTLNEKLQWLKLNTYWQNPVVRQCADKFAVREFVAGKGCGEILNELYSVYNDPHEIDFFAGPDEFVLKCNHGCGGNIICYDKSRLNIADTVGKLSKWMKEDYGLAHVEYSYEGIPRKIICERIIKTEDGDPPKDYKIFCSYGVPKIIYVISGGHGSNEALDYYTVAWEWIPVQNGSLPNAGAIHKKPDNLNEMLYYASKLSEDFPIVRVDLYSEFGKVIFGELTFLPTGGMAQYKPAEYDQKFGDMFPLKEAT